MNEFIVWDNEENIFIENFASEVYEPLNDLLSNKSYDFLPYIVITDINNNKIYADCSIVEFDDGLKTKGYFTYIPEELRYILRILNSDILEELRADRWDIYRIKIIDTIQQNKLGLIK